MPTSAEVGDLNFAYKLVAYVFAYPAAIKGKEIRFTVFDDRGTQYSYTVTAKYDLEASYTDNFRAAEPFPDPEEPTGEGQIDDIDRQGLPQYP